MEKEEFILKVLENFRTIAQKEGVRVVMKKKDNIFGIRVKNGAKEVSLNAIFSNLTIIHMCGAPCSVEEYFKETDNLAGEIPKIEDFLKKIFSPKAVRR